MAVSSGQVSVGTSATSIVSASNGASVRVRNAGSAAVFLGPSGVTTSNGYELAAGSAVDLVLEAGEEVFGIVATGSETVHFLST